MQNPEPSVDFDTVANEKQQHEVNVGKTPNPFKLHDEFLLQFLQAFLLFT